MTLMDGEDLIRAQKERRDNRRCVREWQDFFRQIDTEHIEARPRCTASFASFPTKL